MAKHYNPDVNLKELFFQIGARTGLAPGEKIGPAGSSPGKKIGPVGSLPGKTNWALLDKNNFPWTQD